jgi:hypothetical protein
MIMLNIFRTILYIVHMFGNLPINVYFLSLFLLCLMCTPGDVTAYEFDLKRDTCKNLVLADVLQPSTAYNIAYEWNRFGSIRNWHFEEDSGVGNINGMQCVKQEFDTTLSLPHVFSDYISRLNFDVHISKKICVKNNVMTELVHVDDVSVLSEFSIIEVVTKHGDTLNSSNTIHYELPWYLQFIKGVVDGHIRSSVEDKFKVFVKELCS